MLKTTLHELFNLDGKVAIITGASKGIGKAIARALAESGARVVISSRKQDAVDDVAASFSSDGLDAVPMAAKIGAHGEEKKLVDAVMDRMGRIDVLVNNAACNPYLGPMLYMDLAVYDKIMNVNLKGVFELSRLCQPHMVKNGSGSIINVSSVGGITPEMGVGIYSVSKAALISLTKVMAKEWGPAGIRSNAICPGLIKTRMSEAIWSNDTIRKEYESTVPLHRVGTPDEIAGLALLLATDAGSYINGGIYTCDGGFTA